MSKQLNYEKVWNAMSADSEMTGAPPAIVAALRGLLDPLPSGIAKILDQPVSLSTFAAVKQAVLERAVEIGLVDKIADIMPEGSLGPMSNKDAAALSRSIIGQLITVFNMLAVNTRVWLTANGFTERQALEHPKVGRFNAATLAAYDAGTLTIRGLLETQPMTVVNTQQ